MKIANNPIGLRIATNDEKETAESMLVPANERQNTNGYSFYMGSPVYVLVSETAFPGELSFYSGIENKNGEIDSCGWIGKL